MADNVAMSVLDASNAKLSKTVGFLDQIQSRLNRMTGSLKGVGQGFSSAFSGTAGGGGFSGGGGTGGLGTGGSMMPWIYTKSGAVAYGGAQAAMGAAAAGYSLMPSLSIALPTRAAYYGGAILSPGMTAAGLAQRTLGALGQGVTSPTDAAAAQMMLSQTYNFNPGGASYLKAMQEVGGAARMMNISNPQAAQAIGGLHTGAMSSRLYQLGISTLDPKTGNIRSTEDIYRQIYNRYYGGKGKITTQNIEVGLREGFIGAELRNVLGFSDTEMQMFQKAAINFSQGKGFNLPDATGKGNPQMDIYRQQTSLAQTTESKADELLAGLTTATDAYVKMNQQLQGDGGVVSGLAKLKGVLEALFGTNAAGAVTAIASTVGSVATTALMYKGVSALRGANAAGTAAMTGGAKAAARIGGVKMAGAAATAGSSAARAGATVAGRAAGFALGRAVPVLGGVIGAATGQGFLSTVALGAAGGAAAGLLTGGALSPALALGGAALAGVGWLGAKAFGSMFATSKTQQTGGSTADMSQDQVAQALLTRINAPVNEETMSAMLTWMKREGGNWNNTAKYNPLNTMMGVTGKSVNYKTGKVGRGVQAYQNWDTGLQATVDTLQQPNMTNIVSAFQQGSNARDILRAVENSKWNPLTSYDHTLATSPLVRPGSSSTTSSSGQTVNINLKIDKASDAEAIAFAKKVKEILMKDKSVYNTGSK